MHKQYLAATYCPGAETARFLESVDEEELYPFRRKIAYADEEITRERGWRSWVPVCQGCLDAWEADFEEFRRKEMARSVGGITDLETIGPMQLTGAWDLDDPYQPKEVLLDAVMGPKQRIELPETIVFQSLEGGGFTTSDLPQFGEFEPLREVHPGKFGAQNGNYVIVVNTADRDLLRISYCVDRIAGRYSRAALFRMRTPAATKSNKSQQ